MRQKNRGTCTGKRDTLTFLCDAKLEAINSYGLVHKGQAENCKDISRPAEFLVESTGTVRWRMLTENYRVRARPEQILETVKVLSTEC
jgi:peroxiredoxin